jgi:hypothetical protein
MDVCTVLVVELYNFEFRTDLNVIGILGMSARPVQIPEPSQTQIP